MLCLWVLGASAFNATESAGFSHETSAAAGGISGYESEGDNVSGYKFSCPFPVCVKKESPQLRLWQLRGATASNVVVGSDIEDSLICSGGWMVRKYHLGGMDCRYPRGALYPGINVLMYFLSLGPHEAVKGSAESEAPRTAKPQNEPIQLALITPRPHSPLFRPPVLYEQISALCADGAKQATGDPTATWKVGSERCIRGSVLGNEDFLGREKLQFLLQWQKVDNTDGEGGSHAPNKSRILFFGASHSRDLEAAAGMASVGGRFIGAFIHLVHGGAGLTLSSASKDARMSTLHGVQRFGIQVGRRALEAVQLLFDVYVEREGAASDEVLGDCGDLSEDEVFQVGTLLGQKLRSLLRYHRRRWLRESSAFKVSSRVEPLLPPFFVKCRRVYARGVRRPSADTQSSMASEPKETVTLTFDTGFSVDPDDLGFPIIIYRTSVSAANHALVLGLLHPHEVVKVAQTAVQEFRSQGPATDPTRLPALVDHFYSLRAMLRLLQSGFAPEAAGVAVQSRAHSLFAEVASLVTRAKEVAYMPNREELCIVQWRERLEGATISRRKVRDFAAPFISFFCKFDLQLTRLRDAGTEELEYITFTLGRAIMEGLDVAAGAVVLEPRGDFLRLAFDASLLEDDKASALPEQCSWKGSPLVLFVFTQLYSALCAELPKAAACLLQERLVAEGHFAELIQVAEWRTSGAKEPLHLHTFDLVMAPSNERYSRFAKAHESLEALLGDADRGGLISKPASSFPSYIIDHSQDAWREVAEALSLALQCNLLTTSVDASHRFASTGSYAKTL
ncbi:hypothetical protein Efla_001718 [Eimeria flavescens]